VAFRSDRIAQRGRTALPLRPGIGRLRSQRERPVRTAAGRCRHGRV